MAADGRLLDVLLDSWERNNAILVNLLRALPEGGLDSVPVFHGQHPANRLGLAKRVRKRRQVRFVRELISGAQSTTVLCCAV